MAYNLIESYDSPNFTPAAETPAAYGMSRVVEGITIHWWGDPANQPQFQSVVNYLCRSGGHSSAHFVATGTNRQVACIVAPGDTAWHSGNAWGNARTIGLELDPRARDEDYDVAAELIADIRSAYGDVPIYWHNYFMATQCPGVYDMDRLDQMSYQKYSHATAWGQGGNKTAPVEPTPTPAPIDPVRPLYRVYAGSKQIGAFNEEANAYRSFKLDGGTKITLGTNDITALLKTKYETPSPTTGQPDSGLPVTEKLDYEELKARVGAVEGFIQKIKDLT